MAAAVAVAAASTAKESLEATLRVQAKEEDLVQAEVAVESRPERVEDVRMAVETVAVERASTAEVASNGQRQVRAAAASSCPKMIMHPKKTRSRSPP